MDRRGFLARAAGALTLGPKIAAEAAVGLSSIGSAVGTPIRDPNDDYAYPTSSSQKMLSQSESIRKALGDPSILDLVRKMAREQSKDVRLLDPDLASNRSMSLSAKMRIQRERNEEERFNEIMRGDQSPWRILYDKGFNL